MNEPMPLYSHVSVIANVNKDPDLGYMGQVIDFLKVRNVNVAIDRLHADASFCVVLGGDGTILRVAHEAATFNIPLLGINLGNLGFLTDVDKKDGLRSIEKVLNSQFTTEKRLMLEAEFGLKHAIPVHQKLALNEVHVGTSGSLKSFSVYVNEQHVDTIRADGIIVATPTGSTAYSLSAGGPIIVPDGQMLAITPVCPHSLSSRPWVVSADDEVRIVVRQLTPMHIDGECRGNVACGNSVLVKKSKFITQTIKTTPPHFYAVLRKKKIL